MKKVLIIISFLSLLTITDTAVSQENGTIGASVPAEVPIWQWRCDTGDALLNFNPARIIDSTHTIVFDSIPYAKNYTMVVVYKPMDETESTVWRLNYDEGAMRGLTTEHIISDNVTIRYSDVTTENPIINTLRQTAPDSTTPFVRLTLGGDTLSGAVKVAEVLYFDHRLGNSKLRRVQSALAVRYGITLGPVNYVDGAGDMIWEYVDRGLYHHHVTGIGRDTTYNVNQLQSRSEVPGAILTVWTDNLPEGDFFVCGDNDVPPAFDYDGDIGILNRRWRINCTDVENNEFHLAFDTRSFASANDSLVLLIDGSPYLPDSIFSDAVTYRYVMFPSDTSTFTLAKGSIFWQTAMSNGKGTHYSNDASVKSFVYPNPTIGNYTIEVTGATWVKVNIYNAQGVLMDSYSDTDQSHYIFNGSLPSGNSYYATIVTETGTQTMKLIVK